MSPERFENWQKKNVLLKRYSVFNSTSANRPYIGQVNESTLSVKSTLIFGHFIDFQIDFSSLKQNGKIHISTDVSGGSASYILPIFLLLVMSSIIIVPHYVKSLFYKESFSLFSESFLFLICFYLVLIGLQFLLFKHMIKRKHKQLKTMLS